MFNLEKRVSELEEELAEIRDRMSQFENVLTTAFQLVIEGKLERGSND